MSIALFTAFLLYFSCLLLVGFFSHKKATSEADFVLGSRSLNFWVTALSAHASDMSSWLFMVFPMTLFVYGLSSVWIGIGLVFFMFLNWQFVATKLRTRTEAHGSYTLSSYFEKVFKDRSGILRTTSALISTLFLTHYLAAGLMSLGFLFESIFSLDYTLGITIAILVMVSYTYFGGFVAVAWVDLFQALFLLVVILVVPVIAWNSVGGWSAIVDAAELKSIPLSFLPSGSTDSWLNMLLLTLSWGLGYFGMPHILTKFMGINNPSDLHKSKYVGITWQILSLSAAAFVGLIGIAFFKELANPELIFVEMVQVLFPPFITGIILCAILAAIISTMDSQILVVSSVISEDFFKVLLPKYSSSKNLLRVSKVSVLIISAIAYLIALQRNSSIHDSVLYSWAGLGSSFGPLVIASIFFPRTTQYGALWGMLTGTTISLIWETINPLFSIDIPMMIPGFFANLIVLLVVSRLSRIRFRSKRESE